MNLVRLEDIYITSFGMIFVIGILKCRSFLYMAMMSSETNNSFSSRLCFRPDFTHASPVYAIYYGRNLATFPHEGESITVAKWPEVNPNYNFAQSAKEMERLVAIIRAVRNVRAEVDVALSKPIKILIKANDETVVEELNKNEQYLKRFCNPESLTISTEIDIPEQSKTAVVTGAEIFFPLEGLIDLEEELKRLEEELKKWNSEVERVQKKLANENFVNKAPEKIVQEEREKEKDYLEKQRLVQQRIKELQALK